MHPYQRLWNRACRTLGGRAFRVRYWDGTTRRFGHGTPRVTIVLRSPSVVPRLLLDPELAFGEAFMRGEIEVAGDFEDLFALVFDNSSPTPALFDAAFHAVALFSRWKPLSQLQNQRDVQAHYDLGNDFYKLWLDSSMTYSCAYFQSREDSLEQAQHNKINHVLRKLQLQSGQSLVDVGCGWGALLAQAVKQHDIRAVGITLSEEQRRWFEENLKPELENRAEVRLQHYHDIAKSGEQFDRVVSVGMAEHVGRHNLPGFFGDLKAILKVGGFGVLHCITNVHEKPASAWLVKYIFPGGYIPTLGEVIRELLKQDLVVYDVENIGQHYALTLDEWAKNFERNIEAVRAMYGEEFVRMWRLYLRFSAASFRQEDNHVHQIVFCNGRAKDYPLTREWMYREQRDDWSG